MRTLQVEELEPRLLLHSAGLLPPPHDTAPADWTGDRWSAVGPGGGYAVYSGPGGGYAGHSGPVEAGAPGPRLSGFAGGDAHAGYAERPGPGEAGGIGPAPRPAPPLLHVLAAPAELPAAGPARAQPATAGPVAAGIVEAAETPPPEVVPAPKAPVAVIFGATAGLPPPQLVALLADLTVPAGVAAPSQDLAAGPFPFTATPETRRPLPGGPGQAEEGPRLPGAVLLGALAPGDPAALEAALRRFLDGLERTGQGLAGDQGRTGLWLWAVAAATALAACELARRQMKRPPAPPHHLLMG
jgi:hypothetical protein